MSTKRSQKTIRASDGKRHITEAMEAELPGTFCDNSAVQKVKMQSNRSLSVEGADGVETAFEEAVREINLLLSKYSEILRERATLDRGQIEELENILTEALNLESQLKEKKEHLRRSLSLISDKLQG